MRLGLRRPSGSRDSSHLRTPPSGGGTAASEKHSARAMPLLAPVTTDMYVQVPSSSPSYFLAFRCVATLLAAHGPQAWIPLNRKGTSAIPHQTSPCR